MPLDNRAALEALRKVTSTRELRRDIVTLGMIKDLARRRRHGAAEGRADHAACPLKETIAAR